jgi:hypothetical protein
MISLLANQSENEIAGDLYVPPICLGDVHPYFVNYVLYGLKNENDKVVV